MVPARARAVAAPTHLAARAEAVQPSRLGLEPKYDGFRALLGVPGGRAGLDSPRRHIYRSFGPLYADLALALAGREAALEGVTACLGATGQPQFYDMLQRRNTPCFVLSPMFDAGISGMLLVIRTEGHVKDCNIILNMNSVRVSSSGRHNPVTGLWVLSTNAAMVAAPIESAFSQGPWFGSLSRIRQHS